MCIQFVYINNEAGEGEWQLVIANNRDEMYTRPTKPAGRWDKDPACISGLDMKPSREGGTWIGINTETGKVGSLLNILTNKVQSKNKKGRGNLVTDFLTTSQDAETYLSSISDYGNQYNPFNLVLLEYRGAKWKSCYFTNKDENPPQKLGESIYGISNSVLQQPWKKVMRGKEKFYQIVKNHQKVDQLNQLQSKVIDFLNDRKKELPDPVLEEQGRGYLDDDVIEQVSAIFVDSRHFCTRTNTLLLIDSRGHGRYIERTMVEPVNINDPQWQTQTLEFTVDVQKLWDS